MQFHRKLSCRYNRNQHAVWAEYAVMHNSYNIFIKIILQGGLFYDYLLFESKHSRSEFGSSRVTGTGTQSREDF